MNAYIGYYDRENERVKALNMITWETARFEAFINYNLHVTKKGRLKDPRRLLKFSWEKGLKAPDKTVWDEINKKYPDTIKNGI